MVGVHERISAGIKRIHLTFERLESDRDILHSSDLRGCYRYAERASHCLNLTHLELSAGITDIAQDRQTAKTRDNLTQ